MKKESFIPRNSLIFDTDWYVLPSKNGNSVTIHFKWVLNKGTWGKALPHGIYPVPFFLCAPHGFTLQPRLWTKHCDHRRHCTCPDQTHWVLCVSLHSYQQLSPGKLTLCGMTSRIIHSGSCVIVFIFKKDTSFQGRESNEVYNWGFIPYRKSPFAPKPAWDWGLSYMESSSPVKPLSPNTIVTNTVGWLPKIHSPFSLC